MERQDIEVALPAMADKRWFGRLAKDLHAAPAVMDDAALAKADLQWMNAVTKSMRDGDGRDRALLTLMRRKSKSAARSESHAESGERLRWIFMLLSVFAIGFVSFIAVDASVTAKQESLRDRTNRR